MFGVDDWLIAGGMGLIGGAMASSSAAGMNREQMAFEAAEAQKQRDFQGGWTQKGFDFNREMLNTENLWNMREAEKARGFTSDMWQKTADFNALEAVKNREFQTEQVLQQQKWSEQMSNSAYQRQVADMKAAGINPMLAIMGGGGASTPTTRAAGGSQASTGSGSTSQAHSGNASSPGIPGGSKGSYSPSSAYADIWSKAIQNSVSTAMQIKQVDAEVGLKGKMEEVQAQLAETERKKQIDYQASAERNRAEAIKALKQAGLTDSERRLLDSDYSWKKEKNEYEKQYWKRKSDPKYGLSAWSLGWDILTQPISSALGLNKLFGR